MFVLQDLEQLRVVLPGQEFPRPLQNPMAPHRVQVCHCILNWVHLSSFYSSEIHYNILIPSMPRSPKMSLSLRLTDQNVKIFLPSQFYNKNVVIWGKVIPVLVAARAHAYSLITWTLKLWVPIPLRALIFVVLYSSSFIWYPIVDSIWSSYWEGVVK
jgi:hypothetical protein